jgi:hypothetical protein
MDKAVRCKRPHTAARRHSGTANNNKEKLLLFLAVFSVPLRRCVKIFLQKKLKSY